MADTHLDQVRRAVARALAPEGHGKNHDLVLLACDTLRGTTDPAFDAHVLPIKTWAMAWWQNWRPPDVLRRAARAAKAKLDCIAGSCWHSVAGPTMAMIATATRLGWTIPSPSTFCTDTGAILDLELDPPAAVACEVRQAVRRWRLGRITKHLPHLMPGVPDVQASREHQHHPAGEHRLLPEGTIDLTSILHKMLKGKVQNTKLFPPWECRFRPDLVSAMTGGQWPQARLASVRSWTEDSRCQLCLGDPGTLEHRHSCPATEPHGGWPCAPARVQQFIDKLEANRRRILLTRGLLAVRALIPAPQAGDTFEWLRSPRDDIPLDAKWYIDGSLFDAAWDYAKRTGFGVAVVSTSGDLLAYGKGVPPDWIHDAAGAEAWAFAVILRMCPFLPDTTTDCLNIVKTVARGRAHATAASAPLARVWVSIFSMLEEQAGDSDALQRLRWMPAHGAQSSIHRARRSDGLHLTALDWRANRLVDALAKAAAQQHRVPKQLRQFVDDAAAALEYALAKLATVTYAANHFHCAVTLPDGSTTQRVKRDSSAQKPPRAARPVKASGACLLEPSGSQTIPAHGVLIDRSCSADAPQTRSEPSRKRALQGPGSSAAKRQRALDHECMCEMRFQAHWMANRPAMRAAPPERAHCRFEELRARVAKREAAQREELRALFD